MAIWCIGTQFSVFHDAFSIPLIASSPSAATHSSSTPNPPHIDHDDDLHLEAPHSAPDGILSDVSDAPSVTNMERLASLCPLRRNLCVRDNHWVTPYESDVFNVSSLMFGTGIHQKYKVYRDDMYSEYDPDILSECQLINESLIVLHAWYPHMLWEVWNRIATQLFQYQVLDHFLSKEHRFAVMQLQTPFGLEAVYHLGSVHDLLLSPFTNYPLVHLQSLMRNQTASLYRYGISKKREFYDVLDYPQRMSRYQPMYRQRMFSENRSVSVPMSPMTESISIQSRSEMHFRSCFCGRNVTGI